MGCGQDLIVLVRGCGDAGGMTTNRTVTPSLDSRSSAPAAERSMRRSHRGPRPPRSDASAATRVLDRVPRTLQPPDRIKRAVTSARVFSSVLCAEDQSANSQAARVHAALLASPQGTVERVALAQLTGHGYRELRAAGERHDLLALGAGRAAFDAVQHAAIPVLIARWCPLGTKVTDTILVPVDSSPESGRTVELAGQLAGAHGGTVAILATRAHDPELERAIAASGRALVDATGAPPRLLGQQLPLERAVPAAAAAVSASLVLLTSGSSENSKWTTARLAGAVGCSVLAVPAHDPVSATSERLLSEREP